MVTYDKYYETAHYFGKPYEGFIEYFKTLKRGSLIDLGAGQGRDSIPLSNLGFEVTAVDHSIVGLIQLSEIAPEIKTIHADFFHQDIVHYDYILANNIVHFYEKYKDKEIAFMKRVFLQMKPGAMFITCLLKNQKAEILMKQLIKEHNVEIVLEKYLKYHEFDTLYHFFVIHKPISS